MKQRDNCLVGRRSNDIIAGVDKNMISLFIERGKKKNKKKIRKPELNLK